MAKKLGVIFPRDRSYWRFVFRMYLIRQSPFRCGRICLKIEPYSYLIATMILQRPKNGGKFRLSELDYTSCSRKPKTLLKNLFFYNYRVQYESRILWKQGNRGPRLRLHLAVVAFRSIRARRYLYRKKCWWLLHSIATNRVFISSFSFLNFPNSTMYHLALPISGSKEPWKKFEDNVDKDVPWMGCNKMVKM